MMIPRTHVGGLGDTWFQTTMDSIGSAIDQSDYTPYLIGGAAAMVTLYLISGVKSASRSTGRFFRKRKSVAAKRKRLKQELADTPLF